MQIYKTEDGLYHYGILGMKWGIRRYQNKDGTLTPAGKKRFAEKNIRTEENLTEKTISKGTKMYRTTPLEKDGSPSKSTYVTYLDVDRNLYRAGGDVKRYVGGKMEDPVYEHEYELTTDIRIPSLKTVREVEQKVLSDVKKQREVVESYVKQSLLLTGYMTLSDVDNIYSASKKFEVDSEGNVKDNKSVYNSMVKKYGEYTGDEYYYEAKYYAKAEKIIDTHDNLVVERSLGKATSTKNAVIKELKSQGYNAMYDNASIGVLNDGKHSKWQEGVEPLVIFDSKTTLRETNTARIDLNEQIESSRKYHEDISKIRLEISKYK